MSEALIVRRGGSGGGGGAGGLNFTVKAYSSVPTGTAKENTIAVVIENLAQPMTGWVMQAEEPVKTPGLVWIQVAAESDVAFYADSKGMVKLYPVAVKYCATDSFASVDAYIYQNGWQQFSANSYFLFSESGQVVAFTTGEGGYKAGSVSIGTTISITLKGNKSSSTDCQFVYTTSSFDLTNYTQLKFDYENVSAQSMKQANLVIGATSASSPSVAYDGGKIGNALAQTQESIVSQSGLSGTIAVDVSAVNEPAYIVAGMQIWANSNSDSTYQSASGTITRIYVE